MGKRSPMGLWGRWWRPSARLWAASSWTEPAWAEPPDNNRSSAGRYTRAPRSHRTANPADRTTPFLHQHTHTHTISENNQHACQSINRSISVHSYSPVWLISILVPLVTLSRSLMKLASKSDRHKRYQWNNETISSSAEQELMLMLKHFKTRFKNKQIHQSDEKSHI